MADDLHARHERFRAISEAFHLGDLARLREALGNPAGFPKEPLPLDVFGPAGSVLEYAIYHSPLAFIQALLELGADPNPPSAQHAGFPPLLAALTKLNTRSGSQARTDVPDLLRLLLRYGADPNQRGLNDWTALHMAAHERSGEAIRILVDAGADPTLRTRIDDCLTPREEAERAGNHEIASLLAELEGSGT
ncbi:MAG TPA: ankyrin repeat domain-containing protein [Vicinamibacterales bacterium]|nr:ankyrin repeat domain-containing protein [Vicinamibacterales bacterium]